MHRHPRANCERRTRLIPRARGSQDELGDECNEDEQLWLSTLSRYGTSYKHWALAKSAHELPECPTFRPTLEEFAEPGKYIKSIMPQACHPPMRTLAPGPLGTTAGGPPSTRSVVRAE